jgi:hypothetical protein
MICAGRKGQGPHRGTDHAGMALERHASSPRGVLPGRRMRVRLRAHRAHRRRCPFPRLRAEIGDRAGRYNAKRKAPRRAGAILFPSGPPVCPGGFRPAPTSILRHEPPFSYTHSTAGLNHLLRGTVSIKKITRILWCGNTTHARKRPLPSFFWRPPHVLR